MRKWIVRVLFILCLCLASQLWGAEAVQPKESDSQITYKALKVDSYLPQPFDEKLNEWGYTRCLIEQEQPIVITSYEQFEALFSGWQKAYAAEKKANNQTYYPWEETDPGQYDKAFFKENALIFHTVFETSGSYEINVEGLIKKEDGTIDIHLERYYPDLLLTCDLGEYSMFYEVSKKEIHKETPIEIEWQFTHIPKEDRWIRCQVSKALPLQKQVTPFVKVITDEEAYLSYKNEMEALFGKEIYKYSFSAYLNFEDNVQMLKTKGTANFLNDNLAVVVVDEAMPLCVKGVRFKADTKQVEIVLTRDTEK